MVSKLSPLFATAILLFWISVPFARAGKVIPCAAGYGKKKTGGCSSCDRKKGIEITPWFEPTWDRNFYLGKAALATGGYDVWWDIPKPDHGCQILLYQPFTAPRVKANANPKIHGNVILSVNNAGCFFTHLNSEGVAAAFCCGKGDCAAASAFPTKQKRELPMSRITRGLLSSEVKNSTKRDINDVKVRSWGNGNPWDDPKPKDLFTCKNAKKIGEETRKAGKQQVFGQTINCMTGEFGCNWSKSLTASAEASITNEHSVQLTSTEGTSLDMTAGFQSMIGPTATVTLGLSWEWSKAVTKSTSKTKTKSISKSMSFDIPLHQGVSYNPYFTPTLRCQKWQVTCNGVKQTIDKCEPYHDESGQVAGEYSAMTIA